METLTHYCSTRFLPLPSRVTSIRKVIRRCCVEPSTIPVLDDLCRWRSLATRFASSASTAFLGSTAVTTAPTQLERLWSSAAASPASACPGRHCCTLFQTQAFHACLRLHSPHRAPRLHRSAQALFLQRRHGAADRGTKPLQPFEWRYRGKCFQLWFTVAVSRHHELSPGLVQCSGPSVPSHQRTHPAILPPHSRRDAAGCCGRDFCL